MKNTAKSALFAFTTVFLWSSAFPITKFAAAAFTPNLLGLLLTDTSKGGLSGGEGLFWTMAPCQVPPPICYGVMPCPLPEKPVMCPTSSF